MKTSFKVVSLVLLMVSLSALSANASLTLADNLGNFQGTWTYIPQAGLIYGGRDPSAAAYAFRTDNTAYTLSSVTLILAGAPTAPAGALLQLYSSQGSSPGALLATIGSAQVASPGWDVTGVPTPYAVTFAPSSTISLAGNTYYWAVLTCSSQSSPILYPGTEFDPGGTGPGYVGTVVERADGMWWNPPTWAFEPAVGFMNVQVESTVVPEASTCIAGALLLLPFGASLIRRMREGVTGRTVKGCVRRHGSVAGREADGCVRDQRSECAPGQISGNGE